MSDKKFLSKEERDLERFEEENFTRVNVSKKDKIRMKKSRDLKKDQKIDDFKEFDDINQLLKNQGLIEGNKDKKSIKRNYKDFK